MARVLFVVPPLVGHLNPALAVASVLEAAGHTVAWCVHAEIIGDRLPHGATVFPIRSVAGVDFIARSSDLRGLESVRFFLDEFVMPMASDSLSVIERAVDTFLPDLMVVDHQMVAGALVARKRELPWLSLVTTTASILKLLPSHDAWVEAQYGRLQQGYLPPSRVVARPDFSPDAVVVFSVDMLVGDAYERFDAPYVFVGPSGGVGQRDVAFPWEWLEPGRKKLLVTLGTLSRDRETRFFDVVAAALAELDIQAVFVAPESMIGRVPANVLVRSYVPQHALLPHMDGVICHAGHNTVCESLAAGLPLIVAPIRDDQPIVARQVARAGVAIPVRYGKVTPVGAKKAIEQLVGDQEMAVKARAVARQFAGAPGPHGVLPIVDRLCVPV